MRKLIILFCLTSIAHASELKIKRFALLDPFSDTNTAAEVCLSLIPAPKSPVQIQLTVDPGTRQEAYYNTWVDHRGSTCHIVSTLRGRIQAKILDQVVDTKL
jgi:hypothetical protein